MASDTFFYSNGSLPTVSGGAWIAVTGTAPTVSSNRIVGTAGSDGTNMAFMWTAGVWGNDQEASITMVDGTNSLCGPCVRMSTASGGSGYALLSDSVGFTRIYKIVAGVYTNLSSNFLTPANGSVLKITAVGTTITAYDDGVSIGSVTDASITSGNPGAYISSVLGIMDDWSAADLGVVSFPTTSIIDAFTRANANPLSGSWTEATAIWGAGLKLISNAVAVATNGVDGAVVYTGGTIAGPNFEAYCDVTLPDAADYLIIELPNTSPASDSSIDSYYLYIDGAGAHEIGRGNAGASGTVLGTGTGLTGMDAVGIERVSGVVKMYSRASGTWTQRLSASDSTHSGPFYLSVGLGGDSDGDARIDNVGGGTFTSGSTAAIPVFMNQYRQRRN